MKLPMINLWYKKSVIISWLISIYIIYELYKTITTKITPDPSKSSLVVVNISHRFVMADKKITFPNPKYLIKSRSNNCTNRFQWYIVSSRRFYYKTSDTLCITHHGHSIAPINDWLKYIKAFFGIWWVVAITTNKTTRGRNNKQGRNYIVSFLSQLGMSKNYVI